MNKIKALYFLLFLLLWGTDVRAQFNPDDPPEPLIRYKIELECTPANVGGLSGDGQYSDVQDVVISTWPQNSNYEFQYWEHDGEIYSRNSDFVYRICTRDAKFIAHYEYKPHNPKEPETHFMRRIYLKSQPEGVATFNFASGTKYELNEIVPVQETWRQWGYEFKGWYDGEELVSDDVLYYFTVPDRDVTLLARYVFNPESPKDPSNFYSESCEFLAESSDLAKGTVAVEGLDRGRAVYGSTVTIIANPTGENTFCGWYMGDSLISTSSSYSFVVPSKDSRLYVVGLFLYKPHTLTYVLDGEVYASFVKEMGDSLTVIPDVVRDGYSFLGWGDLPEVMPDGDVFINGSLKLESIRVSQASVTVEGGNKIRVKAFVGSSSMEEVADISWTIGNQSIATVSNLGVIKGIKRGITTITASYRYDSQVFASVPVIVSSDFNRVDLPPVEFEFNYNASDYDSVNNRIANDLDAKLCDYNLQLSEINPQLISGNRLSISQLCKGYIDKWSISSTESGEYFKRIDDDCMTIVCKVKPRYDNSSNKSDLISVSSPSNTNYSLRVGYRNSIYLATRNAYTSRFLDYRENMDQIFAIKVGNGEVVILNLTTGESKVLETNTWGPADGSMNFFYSDVSNYFTGDFYWAYLANEYLSDGEIWDVIDYNERVDKDSIPNVIFGDVNNSGVVNVTDITAVANYMFGNYPPIFNFKASDVNLSRSINVADIAGIVDVIYGVSSRMAPIRGNAKVIANEVGMSCSQISQGSEGEISVSVKNASDISAVEMNLRLPKGLTVIGADMDSSRGGSRTFRSGYVNGVYKLMSYSIDNTPLKGNEGKLFTIKVKASEDIKPSSYDLSLTDVVFSRNGDEIQVPSVSQTMDVTISTSVRIAGESSAIEIRIYDLLGKEVDPNSAKNGTYIVRELKHGKVVRTYKVIR